MLRELIDGEAIVGAAIIDSSGVPVIYHLPNTLTAKTLKNLTPIIELVNQVKKVKDDLLGSYQYLIIKYSSFKLAFFDLAGKGVLLLFVNPVWHVENVMSKIRQFILKVSKLL